jgi:hypothetical protein
LVIFNTIDTFAIYANSKPIANLTLPSWPSELTIVQAADYIGSFTTTELFGKAYDLVSTTKRDLLSNWAAVSSAPVPNASQTASSALSQIIGASVIADTGKYAKLIVDIQKLSIQKIYADYCGAATSQDAAKITAKLANLAVFVPSSAGALVEYYRKCTPTSSDPSRTDELYKDLAAVAPNNIASLSYTLNGGAAASTGDVSTSHINAQMFNYLVGSDLTTAAGIAKYLTLDGLLNYTATKGPNSQTETSTTSTVNGATVTTIGGPYDQKQWKFFVAQYSNQYSNLCTKDLDVIYDAMAIIAGPLATTSASVDDIIMAWFLNGNTALTYGKSTKVAIGDAMKLIFTLYDEPLNIPVITTLVNFKSSTKGANDNVLVPTHWVTNANNKTAIDVKVVALKDQYIFVRDVLNASTNAAMTYFLLNAGQVNTGNLLCALSNIFTMEEILAAKSIYTQAAGVGPSVTTVLNGTSTGNGTAPLFASPTSKPFSAANANSFTDNWAVIIANLLADPDVLPINKGRIAELTNTFFATFKAPFRAMFVPTSASIPAFNNMISNLLNSGLLSNIVGSASAISVMTALAYWAGSGAEADGRLSPTELVSDLTGTLNSAQTVTITRAVKVLKQLVVAGEVTSSGELRVFNQYFFGQQELIMVNYVAVRSSGGSLNWSLPKSEYDALIVNGLMTEEQLLSAVYVRYDICGNRVGALARYMYVERDDTGAPCFH